MDISNYQRGLMAHTVSDPGRNWFGTGKGKDATEFDDLVRGGMAIKRAAPSWSGDEVIYSLTRMGKKYLVDTTPEPPKTTRGQRRYRAYLNSESNESFIEWLSNSYWKDYRKDRGC